MKKQKVVVIVGQTASGKTALSLELAQKIGAEIISADSRQVYLGMDLGSGKVTKEEQAIALHHLLDVADPRKDVFTVADFVEQGSEILDKTLKRAVTPIIVGGTFLYVDALLGKISIPKVAPNEEFRASLETCSNDELFAMLAQKDARRASEIDKYNRVRLVRALEIINTLGSVPEVMPSEKYDVYTIGLSIEKEKLHERIHTRLLQRFDEGMIEEVTRLHEEGVSWERLHRFGLEYRHIAAYLQGTIPNKEALIATLDQDIRSFAKRQMTWLTRDKTIHWYPFDAHEQIIADVEGWLAA
ncbi:tRNA (adenosine(37)-N6)-dimethylallyltransferase MiaA [Candidatus Kaiserbacteria bacterium RIFCSPHIGHO2_02_FULL_50_50]|uniref:tRNA dimethylallyltransferase n=1 Tax=Candidatus Kaiserbacteria bacterium RIFCSPHIGHO2_02_FULL_50_50 TaxID=1798492 RepID=A0A1F6DEA4_9BACT|nr:MAG: tRNA (adenosine(37)-N6)-dimethylallyltransferase MiaA [Candidatus Kaiserbacteria bacterium RIFCSPHIGHO2_02_FULL_50_50]OGG89192.1 MAG: tRNA (adenosine(37)-N6)-dimethylallyltransferase MiaA [Candidatus Kaiserbacteria bacterium RIFCSPLOWO2_12_FULL_50_10]